MAAKKTFQANFVGEGATAEDGPQPRELYDKSRFGELVSGKFKYSLSEALFLLENKKIELLDKNKSLSKEDFLKKARKIDKNFWVKYVVFSNLRAKGYIVKTALKFGADFRVYDKGIKPGEDHAKWIVFPVHESNTLTWHDFSAKNRVSHSTRKNLLIGVVDEEDDVTYYEIAWKKP
ncbi:tRNA-intron lyase [Candidatus Woesearchaeota archaeon]|jgi:tRNA-intron endonuclease, archaea type|nr:tRNA-intron lyase [Candidatus Woesearchaeota archaeon]MBT6044664.1 tRNA-intron lyase [Candidatus Woesearchaeota archaeon]